MNSIEPISTKYGVIKGRDAIFLDEISFSNRTNHAHLKGEISSHLCSKPVIQKWIPYELKFEWIIAIQITELDTWESQQNWYNKTSFDLVNDSQWLSKLSGKKTDEHKHLIVLTYDDVVEVICKSFSLEFGEPHA